MKKILSAIMAIALLLSMAACGGAGSSDDPNLGRYTGYQVDVMGWQPIDEIYDAGENYIELLSGGKGAICVDGNKLTVKWTLEGEALTMTSGGQTCEGTLKDGLITTDFFGTGVVIAFLKDGAETPSPAEAGFWVLYEENENGVPMTAEELKEAGIYYTMQLNEDGTGAICFDSEADILWGDGVITSSDGAGGTITCSYAIADGMLTLSTDDVDMVFYRGDTASSASAPAKTTGSLGYADYWGGDWYGWWNICYATGDWASYQDLCSDVCATIDVYDDGSGRVYIWDDSSQPENAFCVCDVSFAQGSSDAGLMTSGTGSLITEDSIAQGSWSVDPGVSSVSGLDHMIEIIGTATDPENSDNYIEYYIYIRPWGMKWDDVSAADTSNMPYDDMMPLNYYDWYLPWLESGKTTAPASFDEAIPAGGAGGQTASAAGGAFDAGNVSVDVPEGWKAFGVADMWSDKAGALNPSAINIAKGAQEEYEMFQKPYLEIVYYDPGTDMITPDKSLYDDAKDIKAVEIGGRTWNGFTAKSFDAPLTLLWTGKAGSDQFQVTVWTEAIDGKISLNDADVQAIIASIAASK